MEYLDKLAEECVEQAIKDLLARGARPSSKSVPPEASKVLVSKGRDWAVIGDAAPRADTSGSAA